MFPLKFHLSKFLIIMETCVNLQKTDHPYLIFFCFFPLNYANVEYEYGVSLYCRYIEKKWAYSAINVLLFYFYCVTIWYSWELFFGRVFGGDGRMGRSSAELLVLCRIFIHSSFFFNEVYVNERHIILLKSCYYFLF